MSRILVDAAVAPGGDARLGGRLKGHCDVERVSEYDHFKILKQMQRLNICR
jgi:hypothetical protein